MIAAPPDRPSLLAGLLLRDRITILTALIGVSVLAWTYMWLLARQMTDAPGMDAMAGMAMSAGPQPWSALHFATMLAMWWVMMVGMMLPSAAPTLLTFAAVNRRRRTRGRPFVSTAVFAAGYLAVWGAFSLLATLAQWGLEQARMMSPMMEMTNPIVGGSLLVAAGLFQLTPLKNACLDKCRSPLAFVLNHWRDGRAGAFAMGLGNGTFCLGCCWLLMALMFVGGIMNILWMAALTVVVFIEKLFPFGHWIGRAGGLAMIGFGAALLARI